MDSLGDQLRRRSVGQQRLKCRVSTSIAVVTPGGIKSEEFNFKLYIRIHDQSEVFWFAKKEKKKKNKGFCFVIQFPVHQ